MATTTNGLKSTTSSVEEIARRAYLAWERDGRPAGRDQQYWFEAEAEVRLLQATEAAKGKSPAATPAKPAAPRQELPTPKVSRINTVTPVPAPTPSTAAKSAVKTRKRS